MEKKVRGACEILMLKPEGKRAFERPRRRYEDNFKMDLQEIAGGVDLMWLKTRTSGWFLSMW